MYVRGISGYGDYIQNVFYFIGLELSHYCWRQVLNNGNIDVNKICS